MCIRDSSYLTIENRGEIPTEQASRLGNRLYGCDTCQEVCPWNRFARPTQIEAFRPKPTLLSLRKEDLKVFSREDYNRIFAKSAVKRAKYEGLIRNIHNFKAVSYTHLMIQLTTTSNRLVLTQAVYHFKDYFLTQQFRL